MGNILTNRQRFANLISTIMTPLLAAKADLIGGKLDPNQLPPLGIIDFLGNASSQSAMLALAGTNSGGKGDWVIRTDDGTVWIITGTDPVNSISSWTQYPLPAAVVTLATVQTITGNKTVSGALTATGQLLVQSNLQLDTQTISASTSPNTSTSKPIYFCNAASAAITVTLPSTTSSGRVFFFKKTDSSANVVTLTPGADIDGLASITLTKQNDYVLIATTTTSGSWKILSGNIAAAGVVDLYSNQTIAGTKTFQNSIGFSGGVTLGAAITQTPDIRTASATLTTSSRTNQFGDATSGAITLTLPATTTPGLLFVIRKTDSTANSVAVSTGAGGSIDLNGSTSFALNKQWDTIALISTSTSGVWQTIGGNVAAFINANVLAIGDARYTRNTMQVISSATTLSANSDVMAFLASGAVPTLPTAVGNLKTYTIKNTHTAAITLNTTSSQTIDGNATLTINPKESYTLRSDNANWWIV